MLPKGWQRSTIGECSKFLSGNTPSKENPDYWSGDFPWVTVKDMKTLWIKSTGLGLTQSGKAASSIAPANSILVVTRGMALLKNLPVSMAMRDVAFNQDIKAIVLKEKLNPQFFAYQLLGRKQIVLNLVDTAGHGTGRLDTDLLKSVEIVLPPLSEQRRIAQILSTWDRAIEITERLKANTHWKKAELIFSLLSGGRRLSNCNTPWQDVALKDLCTFHKGGGLAKMDLVTGGTKRCILYGELFTTYGEVIHQVVSSTNSTQGFQGRWGDVLVPTATTTVAEDLARAAALLVDEVSVGGDAIVLRPNKERVTPEFLAYTLTYSKRKEIAARAQGATIVHLSVGDLSPLRIAVPAIHEQIAICKIFAELNRQLELIQLDVQKLKQEKEALLTALLAGKRRVHLPGIDTERQA